MPTLKYYLAVLKKFFDDLDHIQLIFSERWTQHTNRRTIIILLIAGTLCAASYLYLVRPPDDFPLNKLVSVPKGLSVAQMGRVLEDQGIVRSAIAFRIASVILGKSHQMRADDYLFKEPEDLLAVIRTISTGDNGLEPLRIRIPEGATTRQMAVILGSQLERFDQANFLAQAQPFEGYLFPDTYFFLPNATEDTVIKAMRQKFDSQIATIQPQIDASGHTTRDIVIMASIIEREAFNSKDRHMISGVLWNRIAKNMPLQVDVTFLYTMGKSTFSLTRKDLKADSSYNTYTNKGLPPTPIGSPSLDSLNAAANPTKSDYLFYLADSDGVTHFSKTYQQHLIKKDAYIDSQ